MANFKHHKPREARSGCHFCKPQKIMGNAKYKDDPQFIRANISMKEQVYGC